MMHEVVTLGETMVVVYPSEPIPLEQAGPLALSIGGAESNLAIGLSQLGHRVRFISRIGNDPFGQRIRAALEAEEIDVTDLLVDDTAPTGIFFREWLPDGKRRVFYYRIGSAASHLAPGDLSPEAFAGIRLLHVSGITPALSASCAATIERAIIMAHTAGALVSFDPNYRPALWDPVTARKALLPLMAQADILLMGHEDSRAILGVNDAESALQYGRTLGARIVVLKEAERGATALAGDVCISIPAEPVAAAIDPVGAGDAFNAGFLSGWLRGDTLEGSLRLGARRGATVVAVLGDYIPRVRS
jgi:2-dehydro-3-deoxygluconokinase